MDLETIANVAVSNWNMNLSAKFTEYLLTGAAYHFPTVVAPSTTYYVIARAAAKYGVKINPLTAALATAAITMIPLGFLTGIITNNGQFGFNNIAAYLFGASVLAYHHYTKSQASPPARASIK